MLVIKDLYSDISDCFWLFYGSKYIPRILKECGLKIISTRKFHIFSALMLDFGKCENDAAWYAKFDVLGSYLPFINNHGSNIIVHCIKL